MSDQERATIAFSLKSDYETVNKACRDLKELLLQLADSFAGLGKSIREQMDYQTWDVETIKADADKLGASVKQYHLLLGKKADLRQRLEPYADLFTPLSD
jgi:hypothetical protein